MRLCEPLVRSDCIMVLESAHHKVHTFSLVLSLPEVGGTRLENQKAFLYNVKDLSTLLVNDANYRLFSNTKE